MFALTVIATTDKRFEGFEPYVASVNDSGTIAFQAAIRARGTGVFVGSGGDVKAIALPSLIDGVMSHPDVNNEGSMCFYGALADGGEGVFLMQDGDVRTLADTRGGFASIGPAGPTMNESGAVAFRADRGSGVSDVYAVDVGDIRTVAETNGPWAQFHGIPVIDEGGNVVFRADRDDGTQGIYADGDGTLRTVVETGGEFDTISLSPSARDRVVTFAATMKSGDAGVFTVEQGRITRIVDVDGGFESYRGSLNSAAGVIRIATPNGKGLGLFAGPDPEADRILAVGDELFGSTIAEFAANPVSVNAGGQIGIRVSLTDGRQLILRADPNA